MKEAFDQIRVNLANRPSQQRSTTTPTETLSSVECETCNDIHVVSVQYKDGAALEYCPDCGIGIRFADLLRRSGITQVKTFRSYRISELWQKDVFDCCGLLIARNHPINIIILYGDPGTGKTHLATATLMEWIEEGRFCKFVRCMDWLLEQKHAFKDNKAEEMFHELANTPLLAIDELDYRTEYDKQTLNDLICTRYAKQYPTIITTNIDYMELERDLARVASRAMDKRYGRTIACVGKDYRR